MKTCKVYKGLNSPCKIKGLTSRYFYIMAILSMLACVFLYLSVSSAFNTGDIFSLGVDALLIIGSLVIIYNYLYKRSNVPKIRIDKGEYTISNRDLYKTLKK